MSFKNEGKTKSLQYENDTETVMGFVESYEGFLLPERTGNIIGCLYSGKKSTSLRPTLLQTSSLRYTRFFAFYEQIEFSSLSLSIQPLLVLTEKTNVI